MFLRFLDYPLRKSSSSLGYVSVRGVPTSRFPIYFGLWSGLSLSGLPLEQINRKRKQLPVLSAALRDWPPSCPGEVKVVHPQLCRFPSQLSCCHSHPTLSTVELASPSDAGLFPRDLQDWPPFNVPPSPILPCLGTFHTPMALNGVLSPVIS